MKKVKMMSIALLASIITFNGVNAKNINYSEFQALNINHAFIVGDYIFNLDHGYSPDLRDIMKASRSIKAGDSTTLHEITLDEGYFDITELYSKKNSQDSKDFGNYNVLYVYRSGLFETNKDYDVLK